MEEQLRLGEDDSLVTLKKAWEKALTLLAGEVNRPSFESFFRTAKPLSLDGRTTVIGASSELARIFLEKRVDLIKAALESTLGREVEVALQIAPKEKPKPRSAEARQAQPARSNISDFSLPLNHKYTFSSFITGPCNRLAHAVAKAVADSPGQVYNPFFVYGGPGLGKTHLIQAIGNQILANHPGLQVAYVSGEMFTSHYVTALREHRSEDFRRKYRSVDIWLLDDVQFLAGKERTKEEFFHTFNALYQMNKQIVLTSDRSPRDLNPIEERLKSRFESGIVSDIAPPDFETRVAILQTKAKQENAEVPEEIIECIANLIQTNVRALEGALVTLFAYTSLMKEPLTPEVAEQVLSRYMTEKRCAELTPDVVQLTVAKHFDVDVADLQGQKRQKELVTPRHLAMYLSRELTEATLPAIGKAFGGRNHATVLHACARIKSLIEEDAEFRSTVDELTQILKSGRV